MQLLMGMFNSMGQAERLQAEVDWLTARLHFWRTHAVFKTKSLDRYRQFVDSLYVKQRGVCDGMLHPAIGMAGEAGEVLDLVKKTWAYDKPIDREKLIEEMGDLYHYMTMMMIVLDIDLGDIIDANTAKLKKRYPNGYSDQAAIERKDKVA